MTTVIPPLFTRLVSRLRPLWDIEASRSPQVRVCINRASDHGQQQWALRKLVGETEWFVEKGRNDALGWKLTNNKNEKKKLKETIKLGRKYKIKLPFLIFS